MEKLKKAYLVFDRYYMHLLILMLGFFISGFFVQYNYITKKDTYHITDLAEKKEYVRLHNQVMHFRKLRDSELNYEYDNFKSNNIHRNDKDSSFYIAKIMKNVQQQQEILARGENSSWAKFFYEKIGLIK